MLVCKYLYRVSDITWCHKSLVNAHGVECTTRDHTDMEPVSVPFYQTWAVVSDYSCATHVVTETVHGLVPRLSFSMWWESRNEALHEHHDNLCQRWHTWYKNWSFISSIPEPTHSTIYHHWVLPHTPTSGYFVQCHTDLWLLQCHTNLCEVDRKWAQTL